jgi:hypothetical protein
MEFQSHLNLQNKAQLQNALLHNLSGTSGFAVESQIGYDLLDGSIKYLDSTTVRKVLTDKYVASTSGAGIVMFATVQEISAGSVNNKTIAPNTLQNFTEATYLNKNTVLPQYINSKVITNLTSFDNPNEFVSKSYVDAVVSIGGIYSTSGTSATRFTVPIGVTMSNTTYSAVATPANLLSAANYYIDDSTKTTTTFDVVYLSGLTGTVKFDWHIIK